MPRDILSEYGRDADKPMRARASGGGRMPERDVRNYQPPVGPSNINDPKGPGLHGENYGPCGVQGPYGTMASESGRAGIKRMGGEGRGMGTNRKG